MTQVKLFGYADKISVEPGEIIQFHVDADGTDTAAAQLVRLIHGDQDPDGPGFLDEEVDCVTNGVWQVEKQYTQLGSFLEVTDIEFNLVLDGSFTLFAFVCPTLPQIRHGQCVIGRWDNQRNQGFCLCINEGGRFELRVGNGDTVDSLQAETQLTAHIWYFVAATLDAKSGLATLHQEAVVRRYNSLLGPVAQFDHFSKVSKVFQIRQKHLAGTPFLIAGSRDWDETRGNFISQVFCGKIDRPGLFDRPLPDEELSEIRNGQPPSHKGLVAYWDTTDGYTDQGIGDIVTDVGPFRLHAKGYNRPVRAQTGWNWDGISDCFRLAPHEYGGIEFHADALIDCNWRVTKTLKLPDDLRSGAYAMRLRAGDGKGLGEEYIVFFVRPNAPIGRLAFLAPTATYLAHANERISLDDPMTQIVTGMTPLLTDVDVELCKRGDFGLSTLDYSVDGQGIFFSSYRRPIVNMRPKSRMSSTGVASAFVADLSIIAWLELKKCDYDVLTDEDLHRNGSVALAPYSCVLTGTRPQYHSEKMLDAIEDYIADGGRLIYMGAAGFDTAVAFRDDEAWIMEVRRFAPAWKTWEARPGEYYMATNGQKGGSWRSQNRPPQKIVGAGYVADGFGTSEFYRRMPDSYHRTVSWITKGIVGEVIGDSGLVYGGAAGLSLDRYDLALGTPPHAKIIASSGGHTDNYKVNPEVVHYAFQGLSGSYDHRIRADMLYFAAPNNGAVFAAGSAAFGPALPANGFDNNCSRILTNVVNAFIKPGALPGSLWINEEKQWK
jgi:N,N-dimethylformamidase